MVAKSTIKARVRQAMKEWRETQPTICPICCDSPATELHHIIPKRMGGNPKAENPANWLVICNDCHAKIHAYKIPFAAVARTKNDLGGYEQTVLEDIAGHRLPALVTSADSTDQG